MLSPSSDVTIGPFSSTDDVTATIEVPYVDDATGTVVDLTGATSSGDLVGPDGTTVAPVTTSINAAGHVLVTLPGGAFGEAGLWQIVVVLDGVAGPSMTPTPIVFVVEADDGWHTVRSIRAIWRDAPANDAQLWQILDVARIQVEAWAVQPVPDPPTPNLVQAQQMQSRNIWNAAKTDPSTLGIGDETGFVIRPFPMDPFIKDVIRPKRVRPVIA